VAAGFGDQDVIFVPEDRPDADGVSRFRGDYVDQVDWETMCLNMADVIVAWVPRDIATMPGFTTNVEWGVWQDSGKIVLGSPVGAPKNRYLEHNARELKVPLAETLEQTVANAIELMGSGSYREDGEREVPLLVWRTPHFQQWYQSQRAVGNVLEHARVVWTFRVGSEKRFVFFWALHAEIFITAEGRSKTNEVVLSRPDIATIVLYRRAPRLDDSEVVLIREFRSPGSNDSGYVWEVPGGSSFKGTEDPRTLASHECKEETGLDLPAERFNQNDTRQLVATISGHKAHLFSAELTDDEVAALRADASNPHGVLADTEVTFVEVRTLREIRSRCLVDWSMLGMIMQVLVP
jgi:8-oxo-dGTP pyrophosphatase MutT (NUDIX family)